MKTVDNLPTLIPRFYLREVGASLELTNEMRS